MEHLILRAFISQHRAGLTVILLCLMIVFSLCVYSVTEENAIDNVLKKLENDSKNLPGEYIIYRKVNETF